MCLRGWAWLPVLGALLALVTVTSTYAIIVTQDGVRAFLPYISAAGEFKLSRNIFGWGLSIYASSAIVSILIKWECLGEVIRRSRASHSMRRLNHAAGIIGVLAALCVTLLANFNIADEVDIHNVCALAAFVFLVTYGILILVLQRRLAQRVWFWRRVTLVLISVLAMAALVPLFIVFPPNSPLGFAGPICEWVMCSAMILFAASYAVDFQHIRLTVAYRHDRGLDAIMLADRHEMFER
jgi:hypothetical protein